MKYKKYTLLLAASLIFLTGCSRVDKLFGEEEKKPLEGDRISVLDLQKNLQPDAAKNAQTHQITIPQAWTNKAWPQAGGYPNHVLQNLALNTENLNLIWKASIGTGSTKEIPLNARPIVVGNAVFALDAASELSAIDTDSGKRVWSVNIRKENEREDVIAGGICFGGEKIFATNGYDELLSVSAQDGSILWRKRIPSPSRAAPTFLNGRVFVTTLDNRLMAFDASSGENIWEYTGVGEAAGLLGAPSPAANDSVVIPAFSSGEVTALRIENGSIAWSDNLSNARQYGGGLESLSDVKAMPALYHGLVIAISFSGKMAAIDEATGMRVWQRDISGLETPWVSGDFVYVITGDNEVAALSVMSGDVIWVTALPRYEDQKDREGLIRWMGPIIASGKLILAGSNGDLLSVDAVSGKVLSQIKTKQKLTFGPIISNETLYLLSDSGTLMAYR